MIEPSALLALVGDDDLLAELHRRGIEVRPAPRSAVVRLPGLVVDPETSHVEWRGESVVLTGRAMEVLYALALARWQGTRRLRSDRLAARVWRGWVLAESLPCLRYAVWTIRKRLPGLIGSEAAPGGRPGAGYWLNLPAGEGSSEAAA